MDSTLQREIREAAARRAAAAAAAPQEQVGWDVNLKGLSRRFTQPFVFRLAAADGGPWEGTPGAAGGDPPPAEGSCAGAAAAAGELRIAQNAAGIGTTVYTAAIAAARYLEHRYGPRGMRGLRVLELGSGTGIVGLVAAALGGNVLLTDLAGPVLDNLRANASAAAELIALAGGAAATAELRWGEALPAEVSDGGLWHAPDVILAIEVIYEREWVRPLFATLCAAAASGTEVIWAHDTRGRPGVALFRELCAGGALRFDPVPDAAAHPAYRCAHVNLLSGRRGEAGGLPLPCPPDPAAAKPPAAPPE
eukprot:TRINITY_DN40596_c0_g1_i1.p1 TRINITY_DN40596_c0_g1~~TRINITY_DN40596_c0_g1_i1.p1  ORF type:complete len:307 (+),score=66.25 TRINITY_DN40596_c0_g1_i1:63-983(+)